HGKCARLNPELWHSFESWRLITQTNKLPGASIKKDSMPGWAELSPKARSVSSVGLTIFRLRVRNARKRVRAANVAMGAIRRKKRLNYSTWMSRPLANGASRGNWTASDQRR